MVTSTVFFAVMNGLMLVVVLHLQIGLGRDVLSAGLILALIPLLLLVRHTRGAAGVQHVME